MANVPTKKLKVTGKFGSYGEDGGYYTPVLTQTSDDTAEMSFVPSKEGMYEVPPQTIKLPGASTGSGVYIGNEAPNDPNVNVWVDPDNTTDTLDIIPVPETAEVGQTIVVKSVDESGKPTEWEAVNLDKDWIRVRSVKLTEDTTSVLISTDEDGNSFSYDKLLIYAHTQAADNVTTALRIRINDMSNYQMDSNNGFVKNDGCYSFFEIYGLNGDCVFSYAGANGAINGTNKLITRGRNVGGFDGIIRSIHFSTKSGAGFKTGALFSILAKRR